MYQLSQATQRDTITLSNLHTDDCDVVYEVEVTKFDNCTLKNDADVKHFLGDFAWKKLDAGYVYYDCKYIGRWRIFRGSRGAVKNKIFLFNFFNLFSNKIFLFSQKVCFFTNTNLHLNQVLVNLLDGAKFYGSTLRAESNGKAFIDCRNSAGDYCNNCRVCEAYRAGAEYDWDEACDQIIRRTEDVVASINANVHLLQEECSRLQSELAALKLSHAHDNLPRSSAEQPVLLDQLQVTRESKL